MLSEWEVRMKENGILDLSNAAQSVHSRVFGFILDNPYKEKQLELIGPKGLLKKFTGDDAIEQAWRYIETMKEQSNET